MPVHALRFYHFDTFTRKQSQWLQRRRHKADRFFDLLASISLLHVQCLRGVLNNRSLRLRGCLREKTRTGASFTLGWLFDFVSRLHDKWVIHILLFNGTFRVDKIHVWFKIANITHALPVPVYRQTDFTPKWVVVSRLHDTVARFRTGVKFSLRCENRGELTPGWLAPA